MAGAMLLLSALVLAVAYRGTAWREAAEKRERHSSRREGSDGNDQVRADQEEPKEGKGSART